MNAITTKTLLSATKGLRIKAFNDANKSIIIKSNPRLNPKENHMAAAVALANKMGWHGTLQGGYIRDGFVWIFVDGDSKDLTVEV